MNISSIFFILQFILILIIVIKSFLLEKKSITNTSEMEMAIHITAIKYLFIFAIIGFVFIGSEYTHNVFIMGFGLLINFAIVITALLLTDKIIAYTAKELDKEYAITLLDYAGIDYKVFKKLSRVDQISLLNTYVYIKGCFEGEKVFDFDNYDENYTYEDELEEFKYVLNKE